MTATAVRPLDTESERADFQAPAVWTPRLVVSVDDAIAMDREILRFYREVLQEGVHYGRIPGVEKPSLWKPGAEKLCARMGLAPLCTNEEPPILDVTGDEHNGEPFIRYSRKCQIFRSPQFRDGEIVGGILVAQAGGSCNSWEPKYRYRDEKRKCPQCGAAAIIKGSEEYGGGWVCWKKRDGCGKKFRDGDPAIEGQSVGKIPNPDILDQDNTIKKMADKRAYIAATLLATGCSDIFTQDMEDFGADGNREPDPPPRTVAATVKPAADTPRREQPPQRTVAQSQPAPAGRAPAGDGAATSGRSEGAPTAEVPALCNRFIALHMGPSKAAFGEWIRKTFAGHSKMPTGEGMFRYIKEHGELVAGIKAELDAVGANEAAS